MSIQVLMPALSPTMTEGKLAKWHVKVGDAVKVEVERLDLGRRAEAQAPLPRLQVALKRHGGGLGRHLAQPVADLQAVADQLHRRIVALAQHRLDRLVQLGQPWQGEVAQRGQRLGQPHRLDHAARRRVEIVAAQ